MLYPFKARKLGPFLAHGRQFRRMGVAFSVACVTAASPRKKIGGDAKLFLNTIINGKTQRLSSDFFPGRGGCDTGYFLCDIISVSLSPS